MGVCWMADPIRREVTKLAKLRDHMAAGEWQAAILLAAKFQQLGAAREAILSAREAYLRPAFQRQIGKDPGALKAAGRAALLRRFGRV